MDSHHGNRACLDLLEMSSSVSADSDIFMFPGAPPEHPTHVAGDRRRHLVGSDDVLDILGT